MEPAELKKGFFIDKGGDEICLLIHGFGGTPAELWLLAGALSETGISVSGICLAGHGGDFAAMERSSCRDWMASAESEYQRLAKSYKKIYVMGLSMGSLIALRLAQLHEPAGIVLLSPPLILREKRARFAWMLRFFMRSIPCGSAGLPDGNEKYLVGLDEIPVRSTAQFVKFDRFVIRGLKQVRAPLLAILSDKDQIVAPESMELLLGSVSSPDKKGVVLHESGHLLPLDCEREKVFAQTLAFLTRLRGPSPVPSVS